MSTVAARPGRWVFWTFVLLMVGLTALFAALGVWQVNRLADKEALIARVAERMDDPPTALDTVAALDPAALDYAPVSVTGTYNPQDTVLVFTSIADANGTTSGPGLLGDDPAHTCAGRQHLDQPRLYPAGGRRPTSRPGRGHPPASSPSPA